MFRVFCIIILATFGLLAVVTMWNYIEPSFIQLNEPEITVYTALLPEQVESYLAIFSAEHPEIQVNIVQKRTNELTELLLEEKDDPQADVIWGLSVTNLLFLEWNSVLNPYEPVGLERVNSQFRDTNDPPYWVGQDVWMSVFCINQDKMEAFDLPQPQSWQDLTKPIYKNYLALPDPTESGTGYMWLWAILQLYGEVEGWAILDNLYENAPLYTQSSSKPCELATVGSTPIGVSYGLAGLIQSAKNPSLELIFPEEGSGWDIEANALVKQVSVKPESQIFLTWAISDSAMRAYRENYIITSVEVKNSIIPERYHKDPSTQLHDKDFPRAAANRNGIGEIWINRYSTQGE